MELLNIAIDRVSDIPIAEQISGRILSAILSGQIRPGERLPTERELAERLCISRGTVKRAYARLVQSGAIDMRQGSGSYVLKNGQVLEENQKKEAAEVIAASFDRLRAMGLSEREILNLAHLHALSTANSGLRKVSIMVVSNNHDILCELEQQLSYLSDASPFLFMLSFLTLDTITGNPDPVQMLLGYDLIIATTIDYQDVLALAPVVRGKILEASISPRTHTLMQLSRLSADSKVAVVYRTEIFRSIVVQSLLSLEFQEGNIFCFHERDYNPRHHADGGVSVVVNFNESPVFTDPAFLERNREFTQNGGTILRFEYQIERRSLLYIEDYIQRLLSEETN